MKRFLLFLSILFNTIVFALEIPDRPEHFTPVTDLANVLGDNEKRILSERIKSFEDSTSAQIAIVIINSLEGESIDDYSQRWAQKWQLGVKGKDNGVLIMVAIQDHKMRIEVGYGLEARLTDIETKDIREEIMKPAFKENNYYAGLEGAIYEIATQILSEKEGISAKEKKSRSDDGFTGIFWGIIILVVIIFVFRKDKKRTFGGGTYSSGGNYYPSSYGSYSDSSYSSYSDSSSSYSDYSDYSDSGGGSFGGGGSSGDW